MQIDPTEVHYHGSPRWYEYLVPIGIGMAVAIVILHFTGVIDAVLTWIG